MEWLIFNFMKCLSRLGLSAIDKAQYFRIVDINFFIIIIVIMQKAKE